MMMFTSLLLILAQSPQKPDADPQLESLTREVQEALLHPVDREKSAPKPYWRYRRNLDLAAEWPRPEFREALIGVFNGGDPYHVVIASSGLLNYGDPKMRELVESRKDDAREYSLGCFGYTVGSEIEQALKNHDRGSNFRSMKTMLLPLSRQTESGLMADEPWSFEKVSGLIAVPRAVEALTHEALTIRIQAFCWLLHRGIVLDTRPLMEAWPQLTDDERRVIIWLPGDVRIGGTLLREALESLSRRSGPRPARRDVALFLMRRLAEAGSPLGRDQALATIHECVNRREYDSDGYPDPLDSAFDALVHSALPEDRAQLIVWSKSEVEALRIKSLGVLAAMDHPEARDRVTEYLLTPGKPLASCIDVGPLGTLEQRKWPDSDYKWHYLRTLSAMLQGHPDNWDEDYGAKVPIYFGYRVPEIIDALEGIAEQKLGWNGEVIPGGFDADAARKTAGRWVEWIKSHDPSKAARKP